LAAIRIGTSGWSYDHWVGPFYPPGTAAGDRLAHYACRFDSVEINNTFYRLPSPETFEAWRAAVPESFVFACKASRYITHMKKLKDAPDATRRFLEAIASLGERLGPVLFQLPPRFRVNPERLADFLAALPEGHRYAFELRDESWHEERILALLRDHAAAFCVYDLAGRRSPVLVTADFAYIRLHGPSAAYQGSYDDRTLRGWAERFHGWQGEGLDVYCYLDNDEAGHAARDALRLKAMLEA
jgi:uncharacterized protein YecE (DUF72 family)